MNFLQLRYFQAVARSEHLTKTADALMISRPSLSASISHLEKELGVTLFDRVGRGIVLNENGRAFLEYTNRILETLDLALDDMSVRAGRQRYSIRIAITSTPIYHEFLERYKASHPSIDFRYQEISVQRVLHPPEVLDFDYFLGADRDIDPTFFEYTPIRPAEHPYIVMGSRHPLAGRSSIDFRELRDETFLSPGHYNDSGDKWIMDLCSLSGFKPKRIMEYDYFFRGKALSDCLGVCVTTDYGMKTGFVLNDAIVGIPVTYPQITRTQCIAWRRGMQESSTLLDFKNELISFFSKH